MALAIPGLWAYENSVSNELKRLDIDLTTNLVPDEPHRYLKQAGVESYYKELRDSTSEAFNKKKQEIEQLGLSPKDAGEMLNVYINSTFVDCERRSLDSRMISDRQPLPSHYLGASSCSVCKPSCRLHSKSSCPSSAKSSQTDPEAS